MNNIIKKISIVLLAFTLSVSCVDLNEDSPTLIKPKSFYTTASDFEAALAGVYNPLYSGWESFDYLIPVLTSGAEDTKSAAPIFRNIDRLQPTDEEAAIRQIWTKLYQSISNANVIVGNLPNANKDIPAKKLGEIEGQAKFARAFAFFYLVRWFGEVQLTTFENQEQVETLKQATVPEIYKSIVSNLQDAAAKLPPTFPEKGRPTKWAAKSLLAKVYLTMAGWPIEDPSNYAKARDQAKAVIDSKGFKLEANFADLWLQKNRLTNKEFIFGFYGSIAEGGKHTGSHMDLSSRSVEDGGWGDYSSEARFFNAFPNNARKVATFTTAFKNGKTWRQGDAKEPFMAKYRDAGGSVDTNSEGFFVVLRYADVLLMFAEAENMAENGPSAAAYDAVNQVRHRAIKEKDTTPTKAQLQAANLTPNDMSQDDFDKAVIAERNWELAFEGNRWFDLVRKKMVVEVNRALYNYVTTNNRLLPKPGQELIPGYLEQNLGY